MKTPPNCIEVNGYLVCRNDLGTYDIFREGHGWCAFGLTKEDAVSTAEFCSAPRPPRSRKMRKRKGGTGPGGHKED